MMDADEYLRRGLQAQHHRLTGCDHGPLLSEIADLNDALSAANQQLAAFKAMPFVPAAEHARVVESRDHALRQVDGLTKELANYRDSRLALRAGNAIMHLRSVMQTLRKECGGLEDERYRNAARAFLVEQGFGPVEIDMYRRQTEEWEARK